MNIDILGIVLITLTILYTPVVLYRFICFCKQYVTTGEFGSADDGGFFSLVNHFHMPKFPSLYSEDVIPTWTQVFKNWFIGTHPLSLMMDCLLVMLAGMIIGTLASTPILLMVTASVLLFVLLLVMMRKRYAVKQAFVENLKGDQLSE